MKIHIFNRQKILRLNKKSVRFLVQSTLDHLNVICDELSIYFVEEKKISQLHEEFFQDPTSTDCISFPIDESFLGEIFVCPQVALRYAQKRKTDPYQEVALYIIHGLLHLIGFDDLEEKERRAMRKKEKSCMRYLNEQKVNLLPQ